MDVSYSCPLGNECETAQDNKIIRCAWYTKMVGKDPTSNKEYEEWGCAIAWMPTMMVEMSQTNRGQTAALESFRNETVKGQEEFTNTIKLATSQKLIGEI